MWETYAFPRFECHGEHNFVYYRSPENQSDSCSLTKQKKRVKPTTTDSIRRQSRKRKLRDSNQETSTDDQAVIKPKKKIKGQKMPSSDTVVLQTSDGGEEKVFEKQKNCHHVVMKEVEFDQDESTFPLKDTVMKTLSVMEERDRLITEKTDIQHVLTNEIKPGQKEIKPGQKDSLKTIGKNTSRDDSGKDSESRRSSGEDVAMETASDHSQNRKTGRDGQQNKFKSKSSDLGTDMSMSPCSIDVDIDDVLGMLSPRNDSMLEDGKEGCKYTPWNFQQIFLPNLATQEQHVNLPQPEYLPESIASAVKEKQRGEKEEGTMMKEEVGATTAQAAQSDILQELVKVRPQGAIQQLVLYT